MGKVRWSGFEVNFILVRLVEVGWTFLRKYFFGNFSFKNFLGDFFWKFYFSKNKFWIFFKKNFFEIFFETFFLKNHFEIFFKFFKFFFEFLKIFLKKFLRNFFLKKEIFRKQFLPTLIEVGWSVLRWVKVERKWNFLTRVGWTVKMKWEW